MPEQHPDFMPRDFLEYLISRYRYNGFGPPMNWYRNYQRTFDLTADHPDDRIKVPAMYLNGTGDFTVELARTLQFDETSKFTDLRVNDLAEAGHWLGQEQPQWVNDRIGEFLQSINY